jgi:hypothetical protein
MEPLRKIPLEMLIQILEDLYNGGADYVDISGDTDIDGTPRDTIKITVKPEYISKTDEDDEDMGIEEEFDVNWPEDDKSSSLSEEDINDLI